MLQEIMKWHPKETGGVLIGQRFRNEIQLTHFLGAGPNAKHERNSFTPDDEYDEKQIAGIFKETQGRSTYLGDWHSHPDSKAYLSERDKNVINKIAHYIPARLKNPMMLIIGTKPFEVKAWQLDKILFPGTAYRKLEVELVIQTVN